MTQRRLRLLLVAPLATLACPSDDGGGTGSATQTGTESGGMTGMTSPTGTSATMTAGTTGATTMVDTTGSTGSDSSSGSTGPVCNPDVVELPGDMLFPEGIHAHSDGTLYVGSLTSREILAITPCTAGDEVDVVEVFNDGADTLAAVGVLVDEASNVLWVCSSDLLGVAPGGILGFSLDDGSLAVTHAIVSGFCNDLTLDDAGNLYATESFASRIMRVAQADLMMATAAEEWSTDTLYEVQPGEFGLNGLAFDGVDAIISVNFTAGEMYSTVIQGNGNAANPTLVDLGGVVLMGPDGLKLESTDNFLVVENPAASLTRVTFDPGGNTVEVVDDTFDVPTTAVVVGPDVWVVESQIDHLMDPDGAGPPELPFVIVRRTL